jgi:uncharacterized protein (DUF736 family)
MVGRLKRLESGAGETLSGTVSTLQLTLTVTFYPTGEPADSRRPTYEIRAKNAEGREVPVGAAWLKTMTKAEKVGEEFLSITIDDPSLPQPLNFAAFKDPEGDTWTITFRRRQARPV